MTLTFRQLMEEVTDRFEKWKQDETLMDMFDGDEVALQKEFLMCIQLKIGSKLRILTEEELQSKLNSYHASMEGVD